MKLTKEEKKIRKKALSYQKRFFAYSAKREEFLKSLPDRDPDSHMLPDNISEEQKATSQALWKEYAKLYDEAEYLFFNKIRRKFVKKN